MVRLLTVVILCVRLKVQFGFRDVRHSLQAHNASDAAVTAHFVCLNSASQENVLSGGRKQKNHSASWRIDILPLKFAAIYIFFPL